MATERAAQMRSRAGSSRIWDATCGIGADLLALDSSGATVGTDLNEEAARFAAANLARAGGTASVIRADAGYGPWRPGAVNAVLLDPDRRRDGHREGNPERWGPPLSRCLSIAAGFAGACVKLPPGFDADALPPAGTLRWVSLEGELRELSLWLGSQAADRPAREAVLLARDGASTTLSGEPVQVPALPSAAAREVTWLAEPDPAVIRAGLVGLVAARSGLAPLAPRLAYLGGVTRPAAAPWLRVWRVLGTSPLDRKRVRALLRQHDVGALTVKKRGHPDAAEVLARRFAGPGERPGLLAVARLEMGHLALLLDRAE